MEKMIKRLRDFRQISEKESDVLEKKHAWGDKQFNALLKGYAD